MSDKAPKENKRGGEDSEMSGAGSIGSTGASSNVSTGGAGPSSADQASFPSRSGSGGSGPADRKAGGTYGFGALEIDPSKFASDKASQSTDYGEKGSADVSGSGGQSEIKRGKKRGSEADQDHLSGFHKRQQQEPMMYRRAGDKERKAMVLLEESDNEEEGAEIDDDDDEGEDITWPYDLKTGEKIDGAP